MRKYVEFIVGSLSDKQYDLLLELLDTYLKEMRRLGKRTSFRDLLIAAIIRAPIARLVA